jgi:hypothetical protein
MDLPRDEMAFRKTYEALLLEEAITTVFRPGNRIYPNRRGYRPGETVTARVIEKCGSDELGIPPLFNDIRIPIRISSLAVKAIADVGREDFEGSAPDVFDRESLEEHLTGIYQKPMDCFGGTVTRIQFRYLSRASWNARRKVFRAGGDLEGTWRPRHALYGAGDDVGLHALSLTR